MSWHHVMEIGAGDRASSQALVDDTWRAAGRITLYEPNEILWRDLVKAHDILPDARVQVLRAAVAATSGYAELIHMGYASYLEGAPSFLATSVEPEGQAFWAPLRAEVALRRMRDIDDGTVDLLIVTSNGLDREVIEDMISRPREIRTKAYVHNAAQVEVAQGVSRALMERGYRGRVVERNQHGTFLSIVWTLA